MEQELVREADPDEIPDLTDDPVPSLEEQVDAEQPTDEEDASESPIGG